MIRTPSAVFKHNKPTSYPTTTTYSWSASSPWIDRYTHTYTPVCLHTNEYILTHSSSLCCLQVLRFYALWDDTDSLYGEKRPVTLHYYLVDDSVDICEHHEANSGRDPFPVLLSRQKIPKHIKSTCGETINTQISTQRKKLIQLCCFLCL